MNLATAIPYFQRCRQQMDALYQKPVFDEWAVVVIRPSGQTEIKHYEGPRPESFVEQFHRDSGPLAAEMAGRNYEIGDFEFAADAKGARFDACVRVGKAAYLFCNNTYGSMAELRADPRWLQAQKPLVDLTERFRVSPLVEV